MEIRSTLADIEAVLSVIGLIISDYPVIQQLALNLCSILCLEQSSCDQLVANDGLNKLLLFVENQGKSTSWRQSARGCFQIGAYNLDSAVYENLTL